MEETLENLISMVKIELKRLNHDIFLAQDYLNDAIQYRDYLEEHIENIEKQLKEKKNESCL